VTARACYPGSFNPPTVAHLAIAEAAWQHTAVDRVDLVVSHVALGKEAVERPTFADRIAVLEAVARPRPWLGVQVTEAQFLADIARGYDVLVVGADKWTQVLDPTWYSSDADHRDALARLPRVLVAPRPGFDPPLHGAEALVLDEDHGHVSSTAVRDGQLDLMLPEAAAFDRETGAWSDPTRYRPRHP
jgi:nicotinic acid mononucleotide adenylyltransferase